MPAKKILVVDDQDEIREIIGISLEQVDGWQAVLCEPGLGVIALAQSEQPDAIILDANMPGMDGPLTFQHLRANTQTRAIPVILLTADAQDDDRTKFMHLGFAAVLGKPFDPMNLPVQVAAALGWSIA
jgi:CheY-like chemotaxis protein